ncbi:MAG: hypothetical protein BWY99_00952 [Synergistetes bacterium ADurb.BinA166]|nr:MAG: hypothetical protein BWY99_00952 [Synergistetes bacterium ADurb.BinA166]
MSGEPAYKVELLALKDKSGNVTISVPKDMKFVDDRVFIESFSYKGKEMLICRTAVYED